MPKIKGWSKYLELPYRIDYNNTSQSIGAGMTRTGLIIRKEDSQWLVTHREYIKGQGQTYQRLATFPTKQEALNYSYDYMKTHPNG